MYSTLPLLLAHNLHQTSYYVPQISSPLSYPPSHSFPLSRDGNKLKPPRLRFPMSSPTPSKNRKENHFSRRITRSNPLIHDRGDGGETRRKLFLKKVREDSEDKRWEARGGEDEMMRTIWMAEEKRRAERQARYAANVLASQEEEELDETRREELPSIIAQSRDEEMADKIAQQEEAELEALLSMMETENTTDPQELHERPETPYGSDDEEYEHIFLDVINSEGGESENILLRADGINKSHQDIMDVS